MRRSSRSQLTLEGRLLLAAPDRLTRLAVVQDLEADQLVDVAGGQRGLIELHAELLHPDGGDVNHAVCTNVPRRRSAAS